MKKIIVFIVLVVVALMLAQYVKVDQPAPVIQEPIVEVPQGKLPAGSNAPGDKSALLGTWVWQRTVMRDAPVVTPKKAGVFKITFGADGNVGGPTDCNGFGGEYTLGSDGIIRIGNLISTQMYCEGSQESVFTSSFAKANSYSFDDKGNLLINIDNDAGTMIFTKN